MSEINSIANGTFTIGSTSATNFVAGPGITIDSPSAGTVRIGNDETVLWENSEGVSPAGTAKIGTLSEPLSNFKRFIIEVGFEAVYPHKLNTFEVQSTWYKATNVPGVYFMGVTEAYSLKPQENNGIYECYNSFGIGNNFIDFYSLGAKVFDNGVLNNNINYLSYVYKVIGINRISGSNA